jgi:hypothetical protein
MPIVVRTNVSPLVVLHLNDARGQMPQTSSRFRDNSNSRRCVLGLDERLVAS